MFSVTECGKECSTWSFLMDKKQRRQDTISSHSSRLCDFSKPAAQLSAYIKAGWKRSKIPLHSGICLTNVGLCGEMSTPRAGGVLIECASICLKTQVPTSAQIYTVYYACCCVLNSIAFVLVYHRNNFKGTRKGHVSPHSA